VAKENGILLLTLPPHTSRKLEPLDCTVFGPYETYYNACLNDWMLSNPGKPVAMYSVAGIIGKIFSKEFTEPNTEKRFHITGMYPLNENIFGEDEFLSSYVTDRHCSRVIEPAIAPSGSKDHNEEGTSAGFIKVSPEIRPFPKAGPKKSEGRKHGKNRILTYTPEKTEIETREPKRVKNFFQGKLLRRKL